MGFGRGQGVGIAGLKAKVSGVNAKIAAILAGLLVLNLAVAYLWISHTRAPWEPSLVVAPDVSRGVKPLIVAERPWMPSVTVAAPVAVSPAVPPPPVSAPAAEAALVCKQWGPLIVDDAARVQLTLAGWGGRVEKKSVSDTLGYIVYWPADRVKGGEGLAELKDKGITDLFMMQSPAALKGGVSLGIFRVHEAAQTHLDNLTKKGIDGLKIAPREGLTKTLFVLTGNAAQMAQVTQWHQDLRRGALEPCP